MTSFFERDVVVVIDTLRIASRFEKTGIEKSNLRVAFDVRRTPDRDPNTCEMKIWNLTDKTRSRIEELQKLNRLAQIEAGYVGQASEIFRGDINTVTNVRDGADWITTVNVGDGEQKYRSARINQSFNPGTNISQVVETLADTLGIGKGNLEEKLAEGNFREAVTQFTKGTVASGKASDELDTRLKSLGFEWSVQNGQLQLLRPKETNARQAFVLSASTGLVGSPEVGEKGIVKLRTLLIPSLIPGDSVKVLSREFQNTFFNVKNVTHMGDTWGNDWYTELEGTPLGQ